MRKLEKSMNAVNLNKGLWRSRKCGRGFTLVELLVVISIIALLLSILMPSLAKAREQAKRTICATNLHSMQICIELYHNDFNGKVPHGDPGVWNNVIAGDTYFYFRDKCKINEGMWACPSAPKPSDPGLEVPWFSNGMGGKITESDVKSLGSGAPYYQGRVVTDYQYLGDRPTIDEPWEILSGRSGNSSYAIAGDICTNSTVTRAEYGNHQKGKAVVGGNVLYVNGSVRWVARDKFKYYYRGGYALWFLPDTRK